MTGNPRADTASPAANQGEAGQEPPFAAFRAGLKPQTPLRQAITAAYRRTEPLCLPPLLDLAAMSNAEAEQVAVTARALVTRLREKNRFNLVEALMHEYALSSQEGVALMCLAEALLRIPDEASRDALIRDKIAAGDWRAHLGHSPSLFVNAATWGLLLTGRLTASTSEAGLSSSLTRLIAASGEPIIRKAVDIAMRMLGEHFVAGQTIQQALSNARRMEARGFRYSYDMLGEAALTAADAARYLASYEGAIHAIGQASAGRGVVAGPGISIKLSALHPRYSRAKRERVMAELSPRVKNLAQLARSYDIGLNIDAEEADRLELSLDLLEALALDAELSGWGGIGFVIQAYSKRCPFVIDWIVDLARRTGRRIMVRLVKGAYWDSEIKRAQMEGLTDFAVFTRKVHTDVSYLTCARKLLAATDVVFPQFATHNAQTLASVLAMAGPEFHAGRYEFQCLHGMGEELYEEVVGPDRLNRPCRIYAPVGTHETLLAYLVRRLLENGANTSFVNQVADRNRSIDDLVADPVATVRANNSALAPHPRIALPPDLYGPQRRNAMGVDLTNENSLADLAEGMVESARTRWTAGSPGGGVRCAVLNPADHRDVVGEVYEASEADIDAALTAATTASPAWAARPAAERAQCLRRTADAMEKRMPALVGLIVREAGRSIANAVAEVRETIDFLRYYADEGERTADAGAPLGPVACISPWNFPLSIFVGQLAAALVAGNPVLAKPAEETPLVAAESTRLLHAAGVPADVLQLLPGDGTVGAALVGDVRINGVVFTGSFAVARSIQRQIASRLTSSGQQIPLIAETGGQNVLIADSSALAEQVVGDAIVSAFDSAGQRCSALRILCVQEDVADRTLTMLKGAMCELSIGKPDRLSVDVGPVITAEAGDRIRAHIKAMRLRGFVVHEMRLPAAAANGTFVAPTIIEIKHIGDVEHEVFGPVLHVLRYRRHDLDRLIEEVNAAGHGLTFGVHSRIDETISQLAHRIRAGNIYVNRNMIGAVVGVQPFGGSRLSGTGPKAGGPLYLRRLLERAPRMTDPSGIAGAGTPAAGAYIKWLRSQERQAAADRCSRLLACSRLGVSLDLAGPVGERNEYLLRPRGRIAMRAETEDGLLIQLGAILATGNTAIIERDNGMRSALQSLPSLAARHVEIADSLDDVMDLQVVLFQGGAQSLAALSRHLAERDGPIVPVLRLATPDDPDGLDYDLDRLLEECSISTNTAAAGGNASLMSIG